MTRDYSKEDWLWSARGRHFQGDDPDDPYNEPDYDQTHFGPEEERSTTAFEAALDRATAPRQPSVTEEMIEAEMDARDFEMAMRAREEQAKTAGRYARMLGTSVERDRVTLRQPSATPVQGYQTEDPMAFLQRGNRSQAGRVIKPRPRAEAPRPDALRPRGLTPQQVHAESQRQSGILETFAQDVRSADPNARVGAHVHRRAPFDPAAQPGTSGYEQMLGAFMGWGLTRQELTQRLAGADLTSANAGKAASYLQKSLGAKFGGTPPTDYRPSDRGPVAALAQTPSHWRYEPAAKQIRYRTGLTSAQLGKDVKGMNPEDWPAGYVTRQGASRVWPSSVYTDLWAGPHKGESILSPYDPSDRSRLVKIAKRTQLQGVYKGLDYYSATGENITAEAPLRMGPTSMRRNRGVVTNQMIALGEWLPEGMEMQPQGWIGSVRRTHTFDIPLPEGFEPKMAERGTEWTTGSGAVQPFEGASPLKVGLGRNWDWAKLKDYTTVNARYYNEESGEYEDRRVLRTVMELGATPETARLSSKTFWSKFMSGVGSSDAFHGETGYGMTQIKEPTQLAYSYYMANPKEMLATLQKRGHEGLTMEEMRGMTWKEISEPLYNAFTEEKLRPASEGGLYVEKPVTIPSVHESQLEHYPEDVFNRTPIGEGRYRLESKRPLGFLKGQFFQMYRRGHALREPAHLPFREVQRLERVAKERFSEHPGVAEYFSEIRRQGLRTKQAYSGIIKAAISGGPHGYPKNAIAPDAGKVQEVVAAARAMAVGEGGEEPAEGVLAHHLMREAAASEWGQKPLLTEEGVLAAPAHAQRFMASGSLSTEEATAYGKRYGEALLSLSEGVGTEQRTEALRGALRSQSKLAESRKFLRRALGTPIPKAFGGPALSSPALSSTEVTAPVERVMKAYGMDPTQRHIEGTREQQFEQRWRQGMKLGSVVMGQPMPGDWPLSRMFNVVHPEVAKERGMQLSEDTGLVVNPKLAEALGRDFDEDLFWNLMVGDVDPEGQLRLPGQNAPGDEPGIPWATEGFVDKWAQTAVGEMQRQDLSRGHKFRNLGELQEAMDPSNLHALSSEKIGEAMRWTTKLRQYIGPTYASLEDIEHVSRSMGLGEEAEKLFGVIHGQTQTPKELPPKLQRVVGMLNSFSMHKGGASFFDKLRGGPGGKGDFVNLDVSAGLSGLQEAFMPNLMGAEQLSPELVSKMAFPRRNWEEAEELVKQWRSATSDFERAKLARRRVQLTGGREEWATQTPLGMTAAAMSLGRGNENVVQQVMEGLSPEQRKLFTNIRSRAQSWRSALSKRADQDPLSQRIEAGLEAAPGLFSDILGQMGMSQAEVDRTMSQAGLGGAGDFSAGVPASVEQRWRANARGGGWPSHNRRAMAQMQARAAAAGDLGNTWMDTDRVAKMFQAAQKRLDLDPNQVMEGLGVESIGQYSGSRADAWEALKAHAGGLGGRGGDAGPPTKTAAPAAADLPEGMTSLGRDLKDTMEWAFGVSRSKFKTAVQGLEMYGPQFMEAAQAVKEGTPVTPGFRQMAKQMSTWLGHAQKGVTRYGESDNDELRKYATTARTFMEGDMGAAIPMMAARSQADLMQQRFESVMPQQDLSAAGYGFLNTANAEQLQRVKGIGPALAKRIAQRRGRVSSLPGVEGFASKSGVLSVKGIGEKSLAQMVPAIEEAGAQMGEGSVIDTTKALNKRMKTLADSLEKWDEHVGPAVENTRKLNNVQKQWTDKLAQEVGSVTQQAIQKAAETGDAQLMTRAMQLRGSGAFSRIAQSKEQAWQRAIEGAEPGRWARFKGQITGSPWLGQGGKMAGFDQAFYKMTSGWRLMMMRRLWGMTGGVAMQNIPVAAQTAQAATGAAAATLPISTAPVSGMGMALMEHQASRQAYRSKMGEAAYRAWGWTQQGGLGDTMAKAAGIGLPALGAGAIAGVGAGLLGLSATGVGLPVAAAAGGLGLLIHGRSKQKDKYEQAIALAQGETPPAYSMEIPTRHQDWQEYLAREGTTNEAGLPITPFSPLRPEQEMTTGSYHYLTPEGRRLKRVGQQIRAGRLEGLGAEARTAAIQYGVEQHRPKGVTEEQAYSLLEQWYQYTPGATKKPIQEILQSDAFRNAALTGRGPQWYGQQAQQFGMLPSDWQQIQGALSDLTPGEITRRTEIASRWTAASRLGVSKQDIFARAAAGNLPNVSPTALNNFIGQVGQIMPVPGFGGMSTSTWGSAVSAAGSRLARARMTGNYTGGWGMNTMWGIQDAMTAENTRYSQAQAGLQMERIAAQRRYLWGGGTPTAPGSGSLWGLQDASRQFGYVQRMGGTSPISGRQYTGSFAFQAQQANMSLAHTMASAGLSLRHSLESTALSREMYLTRYGFEEEDRQERMEDLEEQRQRAATVYGWKMTDWRQKAGRSAIEFGWQMEDYDEGIRRATGYQREQLMKRRERDVIRRKWETTDLQEEKDRMEQRREWEQEDFEQKKENLEELKERNEKLHQLRLEQFDMREEHAKESHDLRVSQAQESHALRMQQLEERKAAYQEEYEHQQKIVNLQREHQAEQLDFQERQAGLSAAHAENMRELQERYTNIQRALATMAVDFDGTIIEGLKELIDKATSAFNTPSGLPPSEGGLPY